MPRLYMITVPGLNVKLDWAAAHDRLLDDFPQVIDVLATTIAATLLIVYEGDADIDDWLAGVSDGILSRRISATTAHTWQQQRTAASASGPSEAGPRRVRRDTADL
jgi:hypothetical protein